jgi:hypothetical protein
MREAVMPNDLPEDLRHIWQNQPVEDPPMDLEKIRRKARQFEKRIRNRNRREYIAAIVMLVVFSCYIVIFSDLLIRVGSGLIIAGTVYMVYQLYKRSSPETLPADFGLTASLAFYRSELARQRESLRSIWSWYLAPFVPGLLIFNIGLMRKQGPGLVLAIALALNAVVVGGVFGGIWWLNRRAAERLSRQIAELDDLGGQL